MSQKRRVTKDPAVLARRNYVEGVRHLHDCLAVVCGAGEGFVFKCAAAGGVVGVGGAVSRAV